MKQRIHDALLGIVGLAGVAFFSMSGMSCEGPKMQCAVGHGAFAVVYKPANGSNPACYEDAYKAWGGACSDYEVADDLPFCAGLAKVEHVGFATYLGVVGREETEIKYQDEDGNELSYTSVTADGADYNTRKIAAKSSTMGGLYQAIGLDATAGTPYAFGAYSSFPDANDICYAGDGAAMAAAELNIPDAMDPAASIHYRQEWNEVRFFVTAGVPGTQVVGKMKFDDVITGCSSEFDFTGLYPAIFCGIPVEGSRDANGAPVEGHVDDDGDPNTPSDNDIDHDGDPATSVDNDRDDDGDDMTPVTDDDGTEGPDVDSDELEIIRYDVDAGACNAKADPSQGRFFGSGINPDFETYCHPEYMHCVLKEGTELVK